MRKFYSTIQIVIFTMLLLIGMLGAASAQTIIWQETFDEAYGSTSGTASGAVGGSWYTDGYHPGGQYVDGVYSNGSRLVGLYTTAYDSYYYFYTNSINISAYSSVSISVDISEAGTLESSDYIHLEYRIDGGSWVVFNTNGSMYDDFGSATATQTGLSGTSLEIRIKMYNNSGDEYYYADNIVVQGTLSTFCNGSAYSVYSSTSVSNPTNALGVADGNASELDHKDDELILDLTGGGQIRAAGSVVSVRWRINNNSPQVNVSVSQNATDWTYIDRYIISSSSYYSQDITLPAATRYILFDNHNNNDVDIDAVTYSCCSVSVYDVTGGESYCSGGSGVSINLSDSESGVTYDLYRDGVATGVTKAGTGAAITFANQTVAGDYTVIGESDSEGCTEDMNGTATVTITDVPVAATNPSPTDGETDVCYDGNNGVVSSVSWDAVADATSYDLYFGAGSLPTSVTANVTSETYSTGTLSASTTYYWKVVAKNSCGDAIGSSTWTFTTADSKCLDYCSATFTRGTDEFGDYIGLVQLEDINNITAGSSSPYYTFFDTQSTELKQGNTYTITIGVGTYADDNDLSAWIDFNQDGDFEDTDENLGSILDLLSLEDGTITFTVPADAELGQTRLRVREVYSQDNIDPCDTYTYGETEDYVIYIIPACTDPVAYNVTGGGSYCSGGTGVSVGLDGSELGVSYQLYVGGSTAVGSAVDGTGSALDFGTQTTDGSYTVVATNTTEACSNNMTGSVPVTIETAPVVATNPLPVDGQTDVCSDGDVATTQVAWNAVPGATSYDVYFGAGSLPATITDNVATTTYTTGSLAYNTTYYWKVVPKNDCGEATGEATWSFTTADYSCIDYCDIIANNVSPITLVSISNLSNSSSELTTSSDYEDYTTTVDAVELIQARDYTITVQGNTVGDFEYCYTVYFDWNRNGDFSDAGERYEIGALTNSTGIDGQFVSTTISVPVTSVLDNTTMRVIAQRSFTTGLCNLDPCEILNPGSSYGQAEDYNIKILEDCEDALLVLSSGSTDQVVCDGNAITDIVFEVRGSATGAGVSGLPAGVTGTYSAGSFTISGTPTETGTFNYEIATTGTPTHCSEATSIGTITIALPTVGGSLSADQEVCYGGTPTDIVLTGYTGSVVKWQKATDVAFTSPTDIAEITTTLSGSSVGAVYQETWIRAVVQNGVCSEVYSSSVLLSMETEKPVITTCPADAPVSCIEDIPLIPSMNDFIAIAGGNASDNCTATADLDVSYVDVISLTSGCQVVRTYTISDDTGNETSCTQTFTIDDVTAPNLTCSGDIETGPNSGCGALVNVSAPAATDGCSFADPDPVYSYYPGNDTGLAQVTGFGSFSASFPEGTTTIAWTITDDCGNTGTCSQQVTVEFPITPITYDNNSTSNAVGSGVKPMLTSTHSYQVDGGTDDSGYSYLWEIYTDADGNGTIDGTDAAITAGFTLSPNGTGAAVDITFDGLTANSNYIISLTKTNTSTLCTKQETLAVVIQENTFDVELTQLTDQCQNPNSTTTYFWTVTFPEGIETEPFSFDYELTFDGTTVLDGTISGITTSATWSLTPSTGTAPFVQTSKSTSYEVALYFTFTSDPNSELPIELKVNATDAFQVSVPEKTNTFKAYQIPTISFE